nr:retrovirus-related Pol polyprotein from transposon TNT 1-94 [Tanacetum cinerariifolium]
MTRAKFDIEIFDETGDFELWRIKIHVLLIQHRCKATLEVLLADMEAQGKAELNKKAYSAVKFEDEDLALLLLTSLPASYEHFLDTLLYGREALTLEEVMATLNSKEIKEMSKAKGNDSEGLYVMGRTDRRDSPQSKGKKAQYSESDRLCSFRPIGSVSGGIIGRRTAKKQRTDNGLEFCNREFKKICIESWIARYLIVVETPQQNGLAERMNITLMDKVRCLLIQYGLPKTFWAEATCMAAFFINRSPSTAIEKKTPMEMWPGHPRYPEGVKWYRLYRLDDESPKIVTSRNAVFNENVMYKDTLKDSGAGADKSEDGDDEDAGDQETDQTSNLTDYQLARAREPKTRTKPLRFRDESNKAAYVFVAAEEQDIHEPLTYQESKAEIGSTKSLLKKEFNMKELEKVKRSLDEYDAICKCGWELNLLNGVHEARLSYAGTANVGLVYGTNRGNHVYVTCFVDSDYAKDPNKGRSITGYTFLVHGCVEAVWLMGLLEELGVELNTVAVNCGNQDAIYVSRDQFFHERTKNINVRYRFIREVLEAKTVKVLNVGTKHNVVDALTKVVPLVSIRRVWVYILRFKHEIFGKFKELKQLVENQTGRTAKKLRTDNGLEFCNREFEKICIESVIPRHLKVVETPQQNGLAKRMNITLMDKVRCLLIQSGLPKTFWAEATCTTAFLINRLQSTAIEKKTPIEMWSGHPSDYEMLRIFGCVAYPYDKQGKLEPRAIKCFLLGYPEDTLKDSGAGADKSVEELQVEVELDAFSEEDHDIGVGRSSSWVKAGSRESKKILGMEIFRDRSRNILRGVSQSGYISKILNNFRIDNGKSVKMLSGRHFKLSLKDCPVKDCDVERMSMVPYANAVESLIYLMVCTRPDIAYAAKYMDLTEAVKEAVWLRGLLEELGVELNTMAVNCGNQGAIHISRDHVFHERTKNINVRYHFIREVLEAKTVKFLKVSTEHNVADALTKVVPRLKLQHCLELLNVDIQANMELKDTIMVAMPNITGNGYYTCTVRVKYEWKPPRCACCKVFGHIQEECHKNIGLGVTKNLKKPCQTSRGVPKCVEPTNEVSNSNPFEVLNLIDNDVELGTNMRTSNLANDAGNPLKKVENPDDPDCEDEGFLWNGDYDEDPYRDNMYIGHDLPEEIQAIRDNLDIRVRGRKKK